jgi:hypothetical protein
MSMSMSMSMSMTVTMTVQTPAPSESFEQSASDDAPAEEGRSGAPAPLVKRSSVRRQSLQQAGRYSTVVLTVRTSTNCSVRHAKYVDI